MPQRRTPEAPRRARWVPLLLLALAFGVAQERELGYGAQPRATEGWYTEEQAARGEEAYERHCARCHGVELEGIDAYAPPLAGEAFRQRWQGDGLDTLFHYTRSMMPLDAPSTLPDDVYVDVLAHVLAANGLPAGSRQLRPETGQLGKLRFPAEPAGSASEDAAND